MSLTIKIHTDSKKRRCALLFSSGDYGRYTALPVLFELS